MDKIEVEKNEFTQDKLYKYILDCGVKLFVCKKENYKSYVGMFGTEYGSIDNEFYDVTTGKKIRVPEGIAHFLEHKLFEQEGGNALDLFAKMGVSSNAYTSFDHTVYYFETTSKFKESLEKLVELVTTPYFTVDNVEKEKGIIMQELKMYEDDPASVVYYNTLKAMYVNHPLNIDIVGTRDSIGKITKEYLYTCYNTFYSPNNMFFIVAGDVEPEETAMYINNIINNCEYSRNSVKNIERFREVEPKKVNNKEITKKLEIYMPYISIGFKLNPVDGKTNKRNNVITKIIEDACFSKTSQLYESLYNEGVINDSIEFEYGYGKDYAYIMILGCSKDIENYKTRILTQIEKLAKEGIDSKIFEITRKKLIGEQIYKSEELMNINRQIIDSFIENTDVFEEINILKNINKLDVDEFISHNLKTDNISISVVESK